MLQTPFSKHTCLLFTMMLHQLWVACLWVVCLCEIFNVFIFYCQDEIIESAFCRFILESSFFKWNIFTYIILFKSKIYTLCVFIWLLLFASFICRCKCFYKINLGEQISEASILLFFYPVQGGEMVHRLQLCKQKDQGQVHTASLASVQTGVLSHL